MVLERHRLYTDGSRERLKGQMSTADTSGVARPLSRYSAYRRAGDLVYFSGIVAADPATGGLISGYADIPEEARRRIGASGEMSTDAKEGPIAAQSWFVLTRLAATVESAGGTMDDVVKLTQFFRDLRDFPVYNRIRALFFPGEPPASTVVQVGELLPTTQSLLEVEAVAYIPRA
jgi:enamine deaminase RidA (YjgF/YER057c/UK114 family)